jgi:hypothetical protein
MIDLITWIQPNLFRIVTLILFLIIVGFDLKSREIPSIFTTGVIFLISVINIDHIAYGIIAFVFAWMLYEAEFIEGIADVKMITALGLMLFNFQGLIYMVASISVVGAAYTSGFKAFTKIKDIPFTPIILASYIGLWIAGVI